MSLLSPALLLQRHGRRDPAVAHLPATGQTQAPAARHGEDGRRDQHAHVQRPTAAREGQHDLQHWIDTRVSLGNGNGGAGGKELQQTRLDALLTREERIKKQQKNGKKKKSLVWFISRTRPLQYSCIDHRHRNKNFKARPATWVLGLFCFVFVIFHSFFFNA